MNYVIDNIRSPRCYQICCPKSRVSFFRFVALKRFENVFKVEVPFDEIGIWYYPCSDGRIADLKDILFILSIKLQ